MTGTWPDKTIDHINGDRSDNRWDNLRLATQSQQAQNGAIRSTNRSGIPGVFWDASRKRWTAAIEKEGKKWLRRFRSLEDAVDARKTKEVEWFGEYALSSPRYGEY